PLVVAYALAGSMRIDLATEPLGTGADGNPVWLRDIWPSNDEVARTVEESLSPEMFRRRYADVFEGPEQWRAIETATGQTYRWDPTSTYVADPPYFEGMTRDPAPLADVTGARALAVLGDSVTTDHISPAGSIKKDSPAGAYLLSHQVSPRDFNSYGARRG